MARTTSAAIDGALITATRAAVEASRRTRLGRLSLDDGGYATAGRRGNGLSARLHAIRDAPGPLSRAGATFETTGGAPGGRGPT